MEQFAYVASHDLREPLRHVAAYVSLIVDLLAYCRLKRMSARLSPVNLSDVLDEVTTTLSELADQCGDVHVRSTLGQGSAFIVTPPVAAEMAEA